MKKRPGPKEIFLLAIVLLGIGSVFFFDPIAQNPDYHNFADRRELFDIPNFWNVSSNLPLLVLGLFGMFISVKIRYNTSLFKVNQNRFCFFAGIFLTGIGSAYYHWQPNNQTLVWDRLPMCIAFMAFFSIVVEEFMHKEAGRRILWPLVALGLMSVLYWQMTESRGEGDLRFYALVQFLPMILIPLILILYRKNVVGGVYFWMVLLSYVLAKLLETYDENIFNSIKTISGHSLKHFAVALVPGVLLFQGRGQEKPSRFYRGHQKTLKV